MASPADRQADALREVERIACALYELVWAAPDGWAALSEEHREVWRGYTRELLVQGVVRPGKREAVEPPMTGQTTIEEQLVRWDEGSLE